MIKFAVPPGIVQSCRDFPIPLKRHCRYKIVPCCHIFAKAITNSPADNTVWLKLFDCLYNLTAFLLCRLHRGIKPEQSNISILRQKLFDLRQALLIQIRTEIFLAVILSRHIPIRIIPVLSLRIIQAHLHPLPVALILEFPQQISSRQNGS